MWDKDRLGGEKKKRTSWVSMAHACKPSYSEGRDQEYLGSKPAPGKEFEKPDLQKKKKKITEKG
jgi:hypothetical protein